MTSTIDTRVDEELETLALVTSDGAALSWDDVVDEYSPALTAFARARGAREPEDLVQNVFLAAVERLPSFVGDRSGLRSLLFTIAYRRIADEQRLFYRRREQLVPEHSPTPDPGPTIEQIIDLGESARVAMQAFSVLTTRERQVVEMRILEEASPAKVGAALGLSSGHIRVIQARALAKIRAHLASLGERGFSQVMVTGATFAEFARSLRHDLPSDEQMRIWIEHVRSSTTRTIEPGALNSSAPIASPSAAERLTDFAHSLISTVVASGAGRIGAVASVVAMSTLPVVPAVVAGADPAATAGLHHVLESGKLAPAAGLLEPADDLLPDDADIPADRLAVDAPALPGPVPMFQEPPASIPEGVERPVSDEATSKAAETSPPATPDVVDGVVEPIVRDTVEPLVDDVVEPLVDEVAAVVEDTVQPLAEGVIGVVEGTADSLTRDVASPLVDEVGITVDTVLPGLGQLLGGR